MTPQSRRFSLTRSIGVLFIMAAAALVAPPSATAQTTCPDVWNTSYGGAVPGVSGLVKTIAAWDPDGPGPRAEGIFVSGDFNAAGATAANQLAFWNGASWESISTPPVSNATMTASAVLNGSLYVATYSPSALNSAVFQRSGDSWVRLAPGTFNGQINALSLYQGRVIAAGNFTSSPNGAAARIAAFNGTAWSPLARGITNSSSSGVQALEVFNNLLFVGGDFAGTSGASTATSRGLLAWNGTAWIGFGSGIAPNTSIVRALKNTGSTLAIGGTFTSINGVPVSNVALYDGTTFTSTGTLSGNVRGLTVYRNKIVQIGATSTTGLSFSSNVAQFDGVSWTKLAPTGPSSGQAIFARGDELFVGGNFSDGLTEHASNIVRFDGTSWSSLGEGTYGEPRVFAEYQGDLYAGGTFRSIAGQNIRGIARWTGSGWAVLGSGVNGSVEDLVVFGGKLTAVGTFTLAGGQVANRVAQWDGQTWSPMGPGVDGSVNAAVVFNNELYIGGSFNNVNTLNRIAKWTGSDWVSVGQPFSSSAVYSLIVYNNTLYAGGDFNNGTDEGIKHIARLDGSTWVPVGRSTRPVRAMAVYNNELYAGGGFDFMGINESFVGRWTGTDWAPLAAFSSGSTDDVYALEVFHGKLYVGGKFFNFGGNNTNSLNLAAYDSVSGWTGTGLQLSNTVSGLNVIGDRLFVGGAFSLATGGVNGQPAVSTGIAVREEGTPATVVEAPASVRTCIGVPATFTVRTGGNPLPTVSWQVYLPTDPVTGAGARWLPIGPGLTVSGFGIPMLQSAGLVVGSVIADGDLRSFTITPTTGSIATRVRFRAVLTSECGNATTPVFDLQLCTADFNCSGAANIDDIFIYLNAWFAQDPRTNIDADPALTIDDLFSFINIWFAGC